METKQLIQNFERMTSLAELKALSNISLENPLSDDQYNRMIELKKEVVF